MWANGLDGSHGDLHAGVERVLVPRLTQLRDHLIRHGNARYIGIHKFRHFGVAQQQDAGQDFDFESSDGLHEMFELLWVIDRLRLKKLCTGPHLHFGLKPEREGEAPAQFSNLEGDNGYRGAIDPAPCWNGFYAEDAQKALSTYQTLIAALIKLRDVLLGQRSS